ncbi:hypothetical protein ACOME3_003449 [Neoechinorhynchus agilis]
MTDTAPRTYSGSVMCQLMSEKGEELTGPILTDLTIGPKELQSMYDDVCRSSESLRPCPMRFVIEGIGSLLSNIGDCVGPDIKEEALKITCLPRGIGFVRPVCRCTSSLAGHKEVILTIRFSPDNNYLATGSGDSTVRIWDTQTETPLHKLENYHKDWVLDLAWSPTCDNELYQLASCSRDCTVIVYSNVINTTKKLFARRLNKHTGYVACISWHPDGTMIASGSKDNSVRIWNVMTGTCERSLDGHVGAITGLKWTQNYLYSSSRDRTVRAWNVSNESLWRVFVLTPLSFISLTSHAHWINSIDVFSRGSVDLLASASDDHTLCLWRSNTKPKSCLRLHGHCQPVIHVQFSPDGTLLASASFDRSVRIWDSASAKHLMTFCGHVRRVYRIVWSADSRYVISASADSTVKLWNITTKNLSVDLPGHEDEVYSLDWSSDGLKVATGGKDRMLKLWRR